MESVGETINADGLICAASVPQNRSVLNHAKVSSRKVERQVDELQVQCLVLNRMIQVAKPDSYVC